MMVKPNITVDEVVATINGFDFDITKVNITVWYFSEDEWKDESGYDILVHAYGENNEHKYFTYAEMIKNSMDAVYIAEELVEYLEKEIKAKVNLISTISIL